ncbi:MAG: glycosyltransferase family 61 protein, partial [Rickettsiales bacterium]|nr:glycosyltransferase family 61 protein [Rickettsiales bacterium]
MEKNYKKERDLEVQYVDRGIIHPLEISDTGRAENRQYGGVTDKNFNFIELSLNKRAIGDGYNPINDWYIGANPNSFGKQIKYIDEDVVFIGPIKCHMLHFLLETFCRCWFFLNNDNFSYKIAFLTSEDDCPLWEHRVNPFFELLNIDKNRLLEIKDVTQFRTVIVPEQSFELNKSYHKKYKDIFDKLKSNVPSASYEKVYFAKLPDRSIGEDLAVEIFEKNGYTVFIPEYLIIKQMIFILNGCKELAVSSGSNAYNAIFLNDSSKLMVLNRSGHVHPIQTMINSLRNLKVTYVDSFTDILPVSWDCGPFLFGYTEHLASFLKSKNMIFDEKKLKNATDINVIKFISAWLEVQKVYGRALQAKEGLFIDFVNFVDKISLKLEKKEKKMMDYIFSVRNNSKRIIYKIFGIKLSIKKTRYDEIKGKKQYE